MLELSKPLEEDIRKNQLTLKVAIKNHQALVLKLRANYDDPSVIKQQLADIQKHIISLGEAQKILVARVRKEIASKSWNNNNDSVDDGNVSEPAYTNHTPSSEFCPTSASGENASNCLVAVENPKKRKHEENDYEEEDEDDDDDEDEEEEEEVEEEVPAAKRNKPMLSNHRPSSPPVAAQDFQANEVLGSSSDDSQESVVEREPVPLIDVSKELFMTNLRLITKEEFLTLQTKNRERRRRRLAGRHSLYTSHWDLTVQRRTRAKVDRDNEKQQNQRQELEKDESPIGSPPIVEIKKNNDSSSDSNSPSPPPVVSKTRDEPVTFSKSACVICRKQGILSVCDSCSAKYHWSCLDKFKLCPLCQVGQIGGPGSQNHSRSGSPSLNPTDETVSKVLGDTSKPPTRVSSMEVIARYFNRNNNSNDESTVSERKKVKKMLEARQAALKVDLATLEEQASQLSASLVNQTANLKELSAGEEKIRERIKIVVDFIQNMKKSENTPS